jgi:hypothetical protein
LGSPQAFPSSIAERRDCENQYRQRVESARSRYEVLRRQLSDTRDLAKAAAGADGRLLHERAQELHRDLQLSLDEYRAELHRFTELVVEGKRPEEKEKE